MSAAPVSPERKRLTEAFGGEYSDPAVERYLDDILARLAPASDTPSETYRVTLLDSPVVNAFALPSGDIFVTRGLIALADDASEVAAVMAHEIGHITARHAAQRAEQEQQAALFTRVSKQLLDKPQEAQEIEARHETVDRAFLARAGIRGGQDRHPDDREGGLRPLCRRALSRIARPLECAARFADRRRPRRPARHDVDPSVHARAHHRGDRAGAAVRRAGDRRDRARRAI